VEHGMGIFQPISVFMVNIPRIALIFLMLMTGSLQGAEKSARNDGALKFQYAFDIGGEPSFAIIEDRDGFLWFSSFFNGLVRYDGTSVKKFREGPGSISSDFVTQLLEDSRGNIWAGTNFGLNRYNKNTNTFTVYQKDPGNPETTLASSTFNLSSNTIIEDRDGVLWFGTQSGLSRFDPKSETFKNYWHDPKDPDSLSDNDIFSVFEDKDGEIWVGTKKHGLNRLDKSTGKFTRYRHDPNDPGSIPDDEIQSIIQDRDGRIWLGARDNGLIRFNKKTETFSHFVHDPKDPDSLPKMSIWDLFLRQDGTIAVISSTSAVGLVLFDPLSGEYEQYRSDGAKSYTLSTDAIQDVFEDAKGILWVVHNNGKVDKHDPGAYRFNLYKHNPLNPDSLASNVAVTTYQDKKGRIWVGNFGAGLDRYNPETDNFTHHKPDSKDPEALPHGYPAGFYEDNRGNFIVSTAEGLALFDSDSGKVIRRLNDDSWFYTMIQDNKDPDVMWAVGWEQSFNRYNWRTGERRIYRHDPDDDNSFAAVTSVRFIRDRSDPDIMWIATWGGGLEKFDVDSETFIHHQHNPNDPDSISSNTVFDAFEDSTGKFWVATDRGLNRFDKLRGKFIRFGREQGFDAKIVHNILEDDSKRLWMGTNIGLVVLDIATEKVIKIYTRDDGLHSHDFFATARGKTEGGRLWFGGFNGLNSFIPEKLEENTEPPQIYLTSLKQDGEELKLGKAFEKLKTLNLDWRNSEFEFEYVAMNFTKSVKNRYRYILEGYDKNWFEAEARRFGRYSGLPGGSYTLRVQGSNNDGVWNTPEREVRLLITVASPPWKTLWAYALYVLVGLAVVFGFLKWRLRVSEIQKIRLQELVDARTEEIKKQQDDLEDAYEVISGSISYASRIQRAVLPDEELFRYWFADHFILWEPRDVVGGDMYWCHPWGDGVLVALCDCTGHGVPGAFMTLISTGAVERSLSEVPAGDVGRLMQSIHGKVQSTLGQNRSNSESDDGLELGVCYLTADQKQLVFSGARFELFVADNGEVSRYKGISKGIGYCEVPINQEFPETRIAVEPGMSFYMTTDGVLDQISGKTKRGFGKKRFSAALADIQTLTMSEQMEKLDTALREYRGDMTRLDDIAVIGFKVG
jgi:ligand-binding sensor domain-containing protein/serine phosphatase RsbU (regulator of sigma subunit)